MGPVPLTFLAAAINTYIIIYNHNIYIYIHTYIHIIYMIIVIKIIRIIIIIIYRNIYNIHICIYIYIKFVDPNPLILNTSESKSWLSVGSIHVGDLGKGMSMSNPKLNMALSKIVVYYHYPKKIFEPSS